jgi:homogentisate 1,2-dioxygenase
MYPVSRGRTAYQAHVQVPEGLFEEGHGREAFIGPCSHLYRLHPPTSWEDVEGTLRPHAFDLNKPGLMEPARQDPIEILSNDGCAVYVWAPTAADEFSIATPTAT